MGEKYKKDVRKLGMKLWDGFCCLRQTPMSDFFERGNESWDSITTDNVVTS